MHPYIQGPYRPRSRPQARFSPGVLGALLVGGLTLFALLTTLL